MVPRWVAAAAQSPEVTVPSSWRSQSIIALLSESSGAVKDCAGLIGAAYLKRPVVRGDMIIFTVAAPPAD